MRRGTIIFLSLMTCACGFFGSNPKKSVHKFLTALASGDHAAAYEHVSERDKKFKDLQTFSSGSTLGLYPEGVSAQTDYEITSVEAEGDRAEVRVSFESSGSEDDGAAMRIYEVIKEGKKWGVFLNWEAEALMAEADQLRQEGNLRKALEKYNRILEFDPDNAAALEASSQVERQVALLEIKESYRQNHVEILNLKVLPDDRRAGPGTSVSGKILNNGHRTLREVEVTVYFVSENGQVVAQKVYRPVPATDLTYRTEMGYLQRGYVREFGYILDDPLPPTWSGRAQALITNIEFEENT
jgi:tetratricopeptide (TPR) repeat protein